jgi:hypothetical protein
MAASRKPKWNNTGLQPLPSLIRASAWDAGNASMRAGHRQAWNEDDYNASVDTFDRLLAACYGGIEPKHRWRFTMAEMLQKAGYLDLYQHIDEFNAIIDAALEAYDAQFAEAA